VLVRRLSRARWSVVDDNGTRSIPQTNRRDISFRVCVRVVALLCRVATSFFYCLSFASLFNVQVLVVVDVRRTEGVKVTALGARDVNLQSKRSKNRPLARFDFVVLFSLYFELIV